MRGAVYGLEDPTDPGVYWYVGQTTYPLEMRLRGHIADARTSPAAVMRWVNTLLYYGVRPQIVLLEETEDPIAAEALWIDRLLRAGHPLLNAMGLNHRRPELLRAFLFTGDSRFR